MKVWKSLDEACFLSDLEASIYERLIEALLTAPFPVAPCVDCGALSECRCTPVR